MSQHLSNVFIHTLGCKVNSYDSSTLSKQFHEKGFQIVDAIGKAQISILNTCSVTENAEKEARYLLRRFRRENPDCKNVVIGCYAQTNSKSLSDLDTIDFIIPNEIKEQVSELVYEKFITKSLGDNKFPQTQKPVADNRQSHFKSSLLLFDDVAKDRTRPFVKIQDGCNNFCAYCLIPYARGKSRSVAPDIVLEKISNLIKTGAKEIVLAGIHLGDYGEDFESKTTLAKILENILSLAPDFRIRISSLEPMECTDEFLALMKKYRSRFCDHFHLPLQSGSAEILKKMRRHYTPQEYFETLEKLRSIFDNPSLGADVIVGFPGETDDHFQETVEFISLCQLSYLHVFPYSKRPNTLAMKLPDHISQEVIKARGKILRDLSKKLEYEFASQFIGHTLSVVWENEHDKSQRPLGLSSNYLKIAWPYSHDIPKAGEISQIKVKGFLDDKILCGIEI